MKIWITYAWKDNEEGNFDYLVQELKKIGVEAIFDKIQLIPGQKLWSQIGDKISKGDFDGWAYLITPNSLNSDPCKEELEYAISRALSSKQSTFPLIGLLHGVGFNDIPTSLKVRLAISLKDNHWKEQIKAGLELRPAKNTAEPQSRFICKVSEKYNGIDKSTIVEIYPRFEEVMYWCFGVPKDCAVRNWGYGPTGGEDNISGIKTSKFTAEGDVGGISYNFFGAGDRIFSSIAAKLIFDDKVPSTIGFMPCIRPFEVPPNFELFRISS